MIVCDIYFYPKKDILKDDMSFGFADELILLFGVLSRNGNIYGDEIIADLGDEIRVTCAAADENGLKKEYFDGHCLKSWEQVVRFSEKEPKIIYLQDKKTNDRIKNFQSETEFYLFTHLFDKSSPLCIGSVGYVLPLFYLSLDIELKEDINSWVSHYRNYDDLYMSSWTFEILAYKQMADPKSELSEKGLEICQKLEVILKKPVYYFLHRYWGFSVGDDDRICPLCGNENWLIEDYNEKAIGIKRWPYKCEKCRLISGFAVSFESKSLAYIGKYKKKY